MPNQLINAMIARGITPQDPLLMPSQVEQSALSLDTGRMQNEAARMGLEDQKVLRPMKNEIAQMAWLRDVGQTVSWENYPEFYNHAITKMGLRPTQLPSPEQVAQMGPEKYEQGKWQSLATLDQKLKQLMQEERLKSAESLVGQRIESAEKLSGERLSSAEKLAEARAKHSAELATLRSEGKSKTEDQRIEAALRARLGREPTDQEVLDEKTARTQSNAPNIYIGVDEGGKPLTMKSRGTPTITPAEVPGGEKVQPKPQHIPNEMVVAEQQISTLQTTLDRVEANYDPAYVGPVAGRLGALQEQWTGIPEKQAMFYADLAQINNSLVYLMSGKQINEQEYKRLLKQLPVATLPEGVFKSRMKTFKETLKSILGERHKNMKSRGIESKQAPNTIGRFTIEVE